MQNKFHLSWERWFISIRGKPPASRKMKGRVQSHVWRLWINFKYDWLSVIYHDGREEIMDKGFFLFHLVHYFSSFFTMFLLCKSEGSEGKITIIACLFVL